MAGPKFGWTENIEKPGAEPDPASLLVEINAATRDRDTAAKLRHAVRLKKFVEVAIVGSLETMLGMLMSGVTVGFCVRG